VMKKQIVISGILLLLLVVDLSGCTHTNTDVLRGLHYTNAKYGFGLNPPEGWTVQESPYFNGTMILFRGPKVLGNFTTDMIIIIDPSFSGTTLRNCANKTIEPFSNNTNFSIVSNTAITLNGMNAYELVYSINLLEEKWVFVEKNSFVLALSYSTLTSTYPTYVSDFDTSVNSLVIK
jgi:hypothetical protein